MHCRIVQVIGLTCGLCHNAGIIPKNVGRIVDIVLRLDQRLAGVERLRLCQLFHICLHLIRKAPQQRSSLVCRCIAPAIFIEGFLRCGNGMLGIFRRALCHMADHRSIIRVDDLSGLSRRGCHPFSADEHFSCFHL